MKNYLVVNQSVASVIPLGTVIQCNDQPPNVLWRIGKPGKEFLSHKDLVDFDDIKEAIQHNIPEDDCESESVVFYMGDHLTVEFTVTKETTEIRSETRLDPAEHEISIHVYDVEFIIGEDGEVFQAPDKFNFKVTA